MKKTFLLFLAFFLCLPAFSAGQDGIDWKKLQSDTREYLTRLVETDTSRSSEGELAAARYIYGVLNREHIDWHIYRPQPNRANIVAYLRAEHPVGKPLLLVSHLDTVNAEHDAWHVPPLRLTEKKGNLYGLGVADCKGMTAVNLAVMTALKRSGATLDRDVIMIASADEESGGALGMGWLVQNRWKDIEGGFALNEGGGLIYADGKPQLMFVDAAQKTYLDLRLVAKGEPAHSSVPPQKHAIYRLMDALEKVRRYSPHTAISPVTKKFFRAIYPLQSQDARTTIDLMLSGGAEAEGAAQAIAQDPFFNSQLRDTITPTHIRGGDSPNSVPAEASAWLNCRLLPTTDMDTFLAGLKTAIAADGVSLQMMSEPRTPLPPAMTCEDELFKAITAAAAELLPGTPVAGGLNAGSTDSEYLRRAGVTAYGLGLASGYGGMADAHVPDEHISERSLNFHLRLVYDIVSRFAVKPNAR